MCESSVDRLVREHRELREHLLNSGQLSFANEVDAGFRKVLLLAAASYFEYRVTSLLIEFVGRAAAGNACVIGIMKNKAIARQYHTYFDWKNVSPGPFYSAFGDAKQRLQTEVQDRNLADSLRSFIRLGGLRNDLVHENYVDFLLNMTVEDIYAMYTDGARFVEALPEILSAASQPA